MTNPSESPGGNEYRPPWSKDTPTLSPRIFLRNLWADLSQVYERYKLARQSSPEPGRGTSQPTPQP